MSLLSGTVAYYKFSGDLLDATSNANNLTNSGSTDTASGFIGHGRAFAAGSSQYASKNTGTSIPTGNSSVSYSSWIYVGTIQAAGFWVSTGDHTSQTAGSFLGMWYGNVLGSPVIRFTQGSGDELTYTVTLTTSTWYHVVGVYNSTGNVLTIYVNGSSVATKSGITNLNLSADIVVGEPVYQTGNAWDGRLDEIGIFNYALSAADVTTLYAAGAGNQYPYGSTVNSNFLAFM